MKNFLRLGLGLLLLLALFVSSCQKEESDNFVAPNALDASSPLTTLLKRVAKANAVDDNVLDSATCFKIKLPIQIIVNNQPLMIDDASDYQQIADILNASNTDEDTILFALPVTLVYNDGTETEVNDLETLLQMRNNCPISNEDPPIGCLDLMFPFVLSLYDSASQTPELVTINNSFDLLAFIANLTPQKYYQINYPLSVTVVDAPMQARNNAELTNFFVFAQENCSGDECENPNILTDNLVLYLPFAGEAVDLTGFATPDLFGPFHYVTDRSANLNGSISFDSNDENTRIDIPQNENNIIQEGQPFTISLWFKRQDANPLGTFEQLIYSPQFSIFLGNDGNPTQRGPVVFYQSEPVLYDTTWSGAGLGNDMANWHHVAVTYDGSSSLILYRDGQIAGGIPVDPVMISDINLGGYFKGYMDDVRIYRRELSQSEITMLYSLVGDIYHCM